MNMHLFPPHDILSTHVSVDNNKTTVDWDMLSPADEIKAHKHMFISTTHVKTNTQNRWASTDKFGLWCWRRDDANEADSFRIDSPSQHNQPCHRFTQRAFTFQCRGVSVHVMRNSIVILNDKSRKSLCKMEFRIDYVEFFHFHSRRRVGVVVAKFNDADVEIGDIMSRIRRHNNDCVIMVGFLCVVSVGIRNAFGVYCSMVFGWSGNVWMYVKSFGFLDSRIRYSRIFQGFF